MTVAIRDPGLSATVINLLYIPTTRAVFTLAVLAPGLRFIPQVVASFQISQTDKYIDLCIL